jgi:glycosyltransferase involved in cell wall biosynthesis
MLLGNRVTNDIRALKEARTLANNRYNVTLLAWDREGGLPHRSALLENFEIKRLTLRTPYGQNMLTLLGLVIYYIWCLMNGLGRRYAIIHCHDVDTLPCGVLLKLFSPYRPRLIYDMHDHPEIFLNSFPLSGSLVGFVFRLVRKYVDNTIVVNDRFVSYLAGKRLVEENRVTVIMNVPEAQNSVLHIRAGPALRMLYFGALSEEKGIRMLVQATRDLKDVVLVLAGRGNLTRWILEVQKRSENIRYLGWLGIAELERETDRADVISILYPPDNINTIMASPIKLFEAISRGIPVIVCVGTYYGDYVRANACGLCIDSLDEQSIRDAVIRLRDDRELYDRLSENAIMLWQTEVNWKIMESRLLTMYNTLCVRG